MKHPQHSPGFLKLVEASKKHVNEVSIEEVRARMDAKAKFHLIDVREDHEWEAGHVAGAKHLGRGIIERDIENVIPDKDAQIVLYCGGGFRSVLSADNLQKMGYRNVSSMSGGFRGWLASGGPVTTPQVEP